MNTPAPATAEATVAAPRSEELPALNIPLSPPANLRDLGGITIAEGVLRQKFAIRTDDISTVPVDYAAQIVDDGLTTVIDLRSNAEVLTTGRGALGTMHVSYHHIPLMSDMTQQLNMEQPTFSHESMGQMYIALTERAASQLVTALNVIAYAPGATAFHCSAGRDRTGVLAAMLLLSLGASDDDIITDYAKTDANMLGVIDRSQAVLGPTMRRLGFDFSKMQNTALTSGGMEFSMEILLDYLRKTHGDPLAPLRAQGLSSDTITRLRQRALAA